MNYCIISNFGDDSIALIQKAYELKLKNTLILSVNTHWHAEDWNLRIKNTKCWIKKIGFDYHRIEPEYHFKELVIARKYFPSKKFHWCTTFLKAIPILNWLEENDPHLQYTILLSNRRSMSRGYNNLPKKIENAIEYDGRTIEFLLYNINLKERNNLIDKTPLKIINHRSLECQPCIFFNKTDAKNIHTNDIKKINYLEHKIQKNMFKYKFKKYIEYKNHDSVNNINYYDDLYNSCTWKYSCGL